jgi:hypothetical protein
MKQLVNNKFSFKVGKTPTEEYEMLQTACDDETLSRSSRFEWFKPWGLQRAARLWPAELFAVARQLY